MIVGFGSWLSAECPKGSNRKCIVLTIDQVGHVLWLIYKMSQLYEQGGLYIRLRVRGNGDARLTNQGGVLLEYSLEGPNPT